eukprot:TRINITY_DN213_c0_g2_i1.p1 TRINITY_DN213_c0_g2~~TRINITY_DN213_c0_g2_i1.p1  ORF type:complete len:660 (+),score=152.29 TRINITY_DN213_c0_g2_i1:400-2379(+)
MAQVQVQPQAAAVPQQKSSGGANSSNNGGSNSNQFVTTSLYVGDLDANVTEGQIYDLFQQIAPVVSVRLCRDVSTKNSLGYAYVNYSTTESATRALELLNFTPLNGKPIRIMYSQRDPSIRKSGTANIFIKNLDKSIDNKALYDTFSAFGRILSCKVALDASGNSKGYGFVQFEQEESAQSAIEQLNGMLINEKQVYVGPFMRKQEREQANGKAKFNNVYVKNLSESTTDEDLKNYFGEYGTITSAVVMRDAEGKSKCFGFVNFENADDAAKAVEGLNGKKVDGKEWYVGKAQKKSEREAELRGKFEQMLKERLEKLQGANLYLKNLDDSIDDNKLRELFSGFGAITSCKVMTDNHGHSRGSGFVAFSSPEEASRALTEMNGKIVVSKPLYVAFAQRKEERRQRLQAQFSQMRNPVGMTPPMPARMPVYPPGGPALSQQMFYGQGPPQLMPPQASGFTYQQQLVPGMRPANPPMANFFLPIMQAQQGQRPGGRRGVSPIQQPQQQLSIMQQQMLPRGGQRVYRFPPRNINDMPMHGGMLQVPLEMGGLPMRGAETPISQPVPIGTLATALANATPEQQRTMLGESLYPLVDQLEHDHAAKVTGMLLEMDQTEVLHLLESPEALKSKVAEAMEVLRNSGQAHSTPTDQLAALSLDDQLVS